MSEASHLPNTIPQWLRNLEHLHWEEDGDGHIGSLLGFEPEVFIYAYYPETKNPYAYEIWLTYFDDDDRSYTLIETSDLRVLRAALSTLYDRFREGLENPLGDGTLFSPEGKSNAPGVEDLDMERWTLVHPVQSLPPWARASVLAKINQRSSQRIVFAERERQLKRRSTALKAQEADAAADRRKLSALLTRADTFPDEDVIKIIDEAIEAIADTSTSQALNKLWRLRQRILEKANDDARDALECMVRDDEDTWQQRCLRLAVDVAEFFIDPTHAHQHLETYELLERLVIFIVNDVESGEAPVRRDRDNLWPQMKKLLPALRARMDELVPDSDS